MSTVETNDSSFTLSAEQLNALLSRRRQRYAQAPDSAATLDDDALCLSFYVGRHRYALPLQHIEAVIAVRQLVSLPRTPPLVAGLMSYRGRPLTVLNLKVLFALPATGLSDSNHVVVLNGAYAPAVLADRLDEVTCFRPSQQKTLAETAALPEQTLAIATDAHGRVLLSAEKLIALHPFNVSSDAN